MTKVVVKEAFHHLDASYKPGDVADLSEGVALSVVSRGLAEPAVEDTAEALEQMADEIERDTAQEAGASSEPGGIEQPAQGDEKPQEASGGEAEGQGQGEAQPSE